MLWECQNACEIVSLCRVLLLAEVPDHVAAGLIDFRYDVKVERVNIIIEGLVIKEKLGEETQILAVNRFQRAVDLKN